MPWCGRCNTDKYRDCFSPSSLLRGDSRWCKDCHAAYRREQRACPEFREKENANRREWKKESARFEITYEKYRDTRNRKNRERLATPEGKAKKAEYDRRWLEKLKQDPEKYQEHLRKKKRDRGKKKEVPLRMSIEDMMKGIK